MKRKQILKKLASITLAATITISSLTMGASAASVSDFANVRPGHGMIKVGSTLVPFVSNIPKDTKLYSIIHTDKTAKPV